MSIFITAATTQALESTTTTTTTALSSTNQTSGTMAAKPVFTTPGIKLPPQETKTDLTSTTETSEPIDQSSVPAISDLKTDDNAGQPDTTLPPAQPESCISSFSFRSGFGESSDTTSSSSIFGSSSLGSTTSAYALPLSKADAPAGNLTPVFRSSSFGSLPQSTGKTF